LVCLALLPGFSAMAGIDWIVLPAFAILIGAYFLIGRLMNRMGSRKIEHLLQEATSWERAGMDKEAQKSFAKAMALVDGFLMSPRQNQRQGARLLSTLTHYYLSQSSLGPRADATVMAYLSAQPQDSEAALRWLQSVMEEEAYVRDHHDLAQLIANAQPQHQVLQQLIGRYFLAAARTDYAALQVYRRVLGQAGPQAEELALTLGEIFLGQGRRDEWALEIYLAAGRMHPERETWRKALVGCLDAVRETEQSRPFLQQAKKALAGLDAQVLQTLRRDFVRPRAVSDDEPPMAQRRPVKKIGQRLSAGWMALIILARRTIGALGSMGHRLILVQHLKSWLKRACMAGLAVGLGIFLASTLSHLKQSRPLPEQKATTEPAPPPVSDPFTLQVAAYFKQEDAQHFVERLKANGLDAYFTEALSGQKKWYQVRVSHFPDQETARRYGESLKAKRIIDDFYVANYKRTADR
jgi:hypothetical protein